MARLGILAILGLLAWGLFFVVMAFSMMPGGVILVMAISFIAGILDCMRKQKREKNKKPDFRLITDKGIFHQELVQGVGLCVPIQVGFYDKHGNLKTKLQLIMFTEDNHGLKWIATGGYYLGGRGNIRKALARMKSGDGYVRIVAKLTTRMLN